MDIIRLKMFWVFQLLPDGWIPYVKDDMQQMSWSQLNPGCFKMGSIPSTRWVIESPNKFNILYLVSSFILIVAVFLCQSNTKKKQKYIIDSTVMIILQLFLDVVCNKDFFTLMNKAVDPYLHWPIQSNTICSHVQ